MKIEPYLSTCTKLKSKWIKDLNIKPTTSNLVEKNVGSTFECMDIRGALPKYNPSSADDESNS